MTVPLGMRGPVFNRWLPIGPDNGIRVGQDNLELLLWLDPKAAQWASELSEEDIPRHVNITAHRIYADISTTTDDAELLTYMANRDFSRQPTEEEEPLAERYEILGREVFSLLRDGINRLMTFIRVEKGQYWLEPVEIDLDNEPSVQFEARAQVDDGSWFRWQSSQTSSLVVSMPRDRDPRFLTEPDWAEAQAFVSGKSQPDLTRQLLAAAEALADAGNERVALTEAVAALEVALGRFAQSPKPDYLLSETIQSRLGLESLKSLHQRLGLTASVSLLLPLLFDSVKLPSTTLATCREAIVERQNVIHSGQRRVDPDKLLGYLREIRELCKVLQDATAN